MNQRLQRGFTLVTAIFILVVLVSLAAAITLISTSQQLGSAADIQGAKAYQAARAGIEWGVYQVTRASTCSASTTFTLTPASLSDFTITVECTPFTDASTGPTVYRIIATACNRPGTGGSCPNTDAGGPGSNYIERRLQVSI